MRILIIDNNLDRDSWGAEDLKRFAIKVTGAEVLVRRGPPNDLPASMSPFDQLLLSGSRTSPMECAPWIDRLNGLIREAIDSGKSVLGVCYGHQLIARALGGLEHVRASATPEFGWTKIEKLAAAPLFEGLPDHFYSFSSHSDEVSRLPAGARLLARSERCAVQAFQLENRPVFGIQFHPERGLQDAEFALKKRLKTGKDAGILNPGAGPKLYDPKVGETIFGNFFNYASGRSTR